jgi:preprotein translocase subunit SecE
MASVTDENEQAMASNPVAGGVEEPEDRDPSPQGKPEQREPRGGFFTVYKSGQGYWTRMASAGGAFLVICLTVLFLWDQIPPRLNAALLPDNPTSDQAKHALALANNISLGICAATFIGLMGLAWWVINKPTNAQFLIETDIEMKKVNWTSRRELIGSTKVVIVFMFLIAFLLFGVDIFFGYLFYFMHILKNPPF